MEKVRAWCGQPSDEGRLKIRSDQIRSVVICVQQGADCLHMVQLMSLPSQIPTISCLIKIRPSPTTTKTFFWQCNRLAVVKFSKSGLWGKVPEGSALIFWRYISLQHRVGETEGSLHAKNQLDSSDRFNRLQYQRTDT